MKLKDFGSYLLTAVRPEHPDRYLHERKQLEWIFISVRGLWAPAVFIMAWLHDPTATVAMWVIAVLLGIDCAVASVFNIKIRTVDAQRRFGYAMFALDVLFSWGIIFQFAGDFYTAAYAGFVFIVIQGAIRYGLIGALGTIALFALGLLAAYVYRLEAFDVRFSVSGYVFWTSLMSIVGLAVGLMLNEGRRQRLKSERYLKENTLLTERQRIARELHDTVLKTLGGLSLEARALGSRIPSAKETAQYIEEVCARTGREIREVIFALRSGVEETHIGSQLSKMLEDWSKTAGIPGEFALSGQDVVLPPEPARQVRNIVSEALTNIRRHASASKVRVDVKISGNEMAIEINDNGRGLGRSPDELPAYVAEGRLGIAGMKERVELLGGRFSLDSDSTGTRISFHVPVSQVSSKEKQAADEPDNDSHSR